MMHPFTLFSVSLFVLYKVYNFYIGSYVIFRKFQQVFLFILISNVYDLYHLFRKKGQETMTSQALPAAGSSQTMQPTTGK